MVVLAILGGSAYAYVLLHRTYSPLTGLPVSSNIANRRPVAVMIDNLRPDARPQSGLDKASVVFETLAEGGITRFMAVFLDHDAAMIGPVRSTRLYYNSWAGSLGVLFGHDGGNVDALQQLPHLSTVFDEDATFAGNAYWRSSARLAPHNEYTSTTRLRLYAQGHGASLTGARYSLPHKSDAPRSQRSNHFTLNIQFSYGDYNVSWQYDPIANDYLRSMGGAPHVDAVTGRQLRAKNVVVMFTEETSAYDPFTVGAIHLRTTGTGKATVYEDGTAISGTWSQATPIGRLQWLDSGGNPIKLNRGVTWVEVVPTGNSVTTS